MANGLKAGDEGGGEGMPKGPNSFNSRRASWASFPLGFRLLFLLTRHTGGPSGSCQDRCRQAAGTSGQQSHVIRQYLPSCMMFNIDLQCECLTVSQKLQQQKHGEGVTCCMHLTHSASALGTLEKAP